MKSKLLSSLSLFGILLSLAAPGFADEPADQTKKEVKEGEKAPEFTLTSNTGKQVSLSDFSGKKNVVLLFSRASW